MSAVLARWNTLPSEEAAREILPCCGSDTWAASMASKRPIHDEVSLIETSDAIWQGLGESGWLEAFRSHPRIGESRADKTAAAQSSQWSEQEQRQAASADEATELRQAAEEQRQIMHIRLKKWMAG